VEANIAIQDSSKDNHRAWLWTFLVVLVLSQLYFVRELVAAFVLFAILFLAITCMLVAFYMLLKSLELAVARLAALRQPVIGMAAVGNMATVVRENRKAA
jgi:drug/metabolite transporter (DMT)-like permease